MKKLLAALLVLTTVGCQMRANPWGHNMTEFVDNNGHKVEVWHYTSMTATGSSYVEFSHPAPVLGHGVCPTGRMTVDKAFELYPAYEKELLFVSDLPTNPTKSPTKQVVKDKTAQ